MKTKQLFILLSSVILALSISATTLISAGVKANKVSENSMDLSGVSDVKVIISNSNEYEE